MILAPLAVGQTCEAALAMNFPANHGTNPLALSGLDAFIPGNSLAGGTNDAIDFVDTATYIFLAFIGIGQDTRCNVRPGQVKYLRPCGRLNEVGTDNPADTRAAEGAGNTGTGPA